MELQHSFTVPADVDKAWATLLDLEVVAPCFPGATLTGSHGDEFSGLVKVKLGPVSLQYAGKGRFVERDDVAHRAVIEAHGSDKRGNGTAGATVVAQLQPEGEGATRVVVATQLKVTGRPAQFGRGVMQDVGSRLIDQFATALGRRLAGEPGADEAAPAAVAAPSTAAPSTAAPADGPVTDGPVTDGAVAGAPPQTIGTPPSEPVGSRPGAPRPVAVSAQPPRVLADRSSTSDELDLNAVVLPVLARQYGSTVLAVLVTGVVTWLLARCRYRRR
ncbi:MAG TPA: SRPBCC family protein [Kineosporiaceae bacterium]